MAVATAGCTLPEACNYDIEANVLDASKCILVDECGICEGPGAIYDCGCTDTPEGDCDCDGNQLDALNVCGGSCTADADGDGICDDGDDCIGEADACGVCNGPGAIYECGCSEPDPAACDCAGNALDALGACGGNCLEDTDNDGICDLDADGNQLDDCVGELDACGVCNGSGPILGCGCEDIPDGYCDCSGNVLDVVGTCGGACQNDFNGDGICDDESIPGCTYEVACNYDPSASIYDDSCDFTSCYGCTDPLACNYSSAATFDNGVCWYADPSYDCDFNCLIDTDGDGVCDGLEVYGCTDDDACNFWASATELDESCTYPGCNDPGACNFDAGAGCDDGSCVGDGQIGCIDSEACNFDASAICSDGSCQYLDECGECGGTGTLGCNNPLADNFDDTATCDDGSCVVYGCTVDLACNYEPTANIEDNSCEFGTCPGCNIANDPAYNPTSTNDSLCGISVQFTNCGAEGRIGPTQSQCNQEYGGGVVTSFDGIQHYTIVQSGWYEIEAWGAQGGSMNNQAIGGLGAHMKGEFMLEQGQNIFVLVGQQGIEAGYGSGGGGGTFVTAGASVNGEILIIAGGGGGSNNYSDNVSGGPGLASTAAGNSNVNIGNSECSCGGDGMGGVNGNGGGHGCAGGGGGYYSSGLNGDHQASGGASFILGGTGGESTNSPQPHGGFGGGGAGSPNNGYGGGGGGYSGGGGGEWSPAGNGGGGGSFNNGLNQLNIANNNFGDGKVVINVLSLVD